MNVSFRWRSDNPLSRQRTSFFASSPRLRFTDGLKYVEGEKPQEASMTSVKKKKEAAVSVGRNELPKAELDKMKSGNE